MVELSQQYANTTVTVHWLETLPIVAKNSILNKVEFPISVFENVAMHEN